MDDLLRVPGAGSTGGAGGLGGDEIEGGHELDRFHRAMEAQRRTFGRPSRAFLSVSALCCPLGRAGDMANNKFMARWGPLLFPLVYDIIVNDAVVGALTASAAEGAMAEGNARMVLLGLAAVTLVGSLLVHFLQHRLWIGALMRALVGVGELVARAEAATVLQVGPVRGATVLHSAAYALRAVLPPPWVSHRTLWSAIVVRQLVEVAAFGALAEEARAKVADDESIPPVGLAMVVLDVAWFVLLYSVWRRHVPLRARVPRRAHMAV